MNEKIKELIDWCQTETDFCIDIMNPEHGYNSYHTHRAEAKKQVLDVVKDKLCNIYEDDKPDYCVDEDETKDWKNILESQTRLSITKCLFDTINKYRELNSDYTIVLKTPGNTAKAKFDACSIYEGREGSLVFDAE